VGTLEQADPRWSDCYAGKSASYALGQEDEGLACTTLDTHLSLASAASRMTSTAACTSMHCCKGKVPRHYALIGAADLTSEIALGLTRHAGCTRFRPEAGMLALSRETAPAQYSCQA
jgi:hypothetical protein